MHLIGIHTDRRIADPCYCSDSLGNKRKEGTMTYIETFIAGSVVITITFVLPAVVIFNAYVGV